MNITSAIISGSKILRNKFISSHRLDSEILMAKTIKKDRNYILLNSESVLNKNDLNYFFSLIEQRSLGSPVAYLTNKKFFPAFSLKFERKMQKLMKQWLTGTSSHCENKLAGISFSKKMRKKSPLEKKCVYNT